jgi:hypothetical protein
MKPQLQRFILGYLATTSFVVGIWAQILPIAFYKHFPGFGHVWVAIDGPYNEHLIRDVGGLNIALGAVLLIAAIRLERWIVIAAASASLLYGLPHLIYHILNRGLLNTTDSIASIGGLFAFALLPAVLLARSLQRNVQR